MLNLRSLRNWSNRAKSWLRSILVEHIDIVSKWVTILAILIGGIWVYYNFNITDTNKSNAEIAISTEILPYDAKSSLLVIYIKPKNIGKVPIEITGDGITLTLKEIPKDAKVGHIDMEKIPPTLSVPNLVKKYDGYLLEPGIEYNEVETFVLPHGNTYLVEAVVDLGDDDEDVGSYHVVQIK
jgi:hypothetical protein